jgi:hypothetical protein
MAEKHKAFQSDPGMRIADNVHEMTKTELMEDWWRVFHNVLSYKDGRYFKDNMTFYEDHQIQTFSLQPYNSPLSLHITMFL